MHFQGEDHPKPNLKQHMEKVMNDQQKKRQNFQEKLRQSPKYMVTILSNDFDESATLDNVHKKSSGMSYSKNLAHTPDLVEIQESEQMTKLNPGYTEKSRTPRIISPLKNTIKQKKANDTQRVKHEALSSLE